MKRRLLISKETLCVEGYRIETGAFGYMQTDRYAVCKRTPRLMDSWWYYQGVGAGKNCIVSGSFENRSIELTYRREELDGEKARMQSKRWVIGCTN